MASKLKAHTVGRFARNSLARPSKCTKCESPFHSSLQCSQGRTPMERTGRVNPRRETPRRVVRATGRTDEVTPAEREYMARVRELPCCALGQLGHSACSGPPVVHHAGRHVAGQKCSHYETIRLCDRAHKDLHDNPGNGWTRAAGLDGAGVRAFEDFWIARTQRELGYTPDAPLDSF
jgi:hypothetical protein